MLDNNRYVSPDLGQYILQALSVCKPHNINDLTQRENQIAQLIMKGMPGSKISALLGIKPSTVSSFKMKIFQKMGVKNALELIKINR